MRYSHAGRAGALLLMLLGCSQGAQPEADLRITVLARNTPPLDQLEGVELGMSLSRLRAARPAMGYVESVGFAEVIGPDSVIYTLYPPPVRPGIPQDSTQFDDTAPLLGVELLRRLPSDSAALRLWRQAVHALVPDNGAPTCFELPSRDNALGAAWESSAHGVAVLLNARWSPRTALTRAANVTPRLVVTVAGSLTGAIPGYESRTQDDCPLVP